MYINLKKLLIQLLIWSLIGLVAFMSIIVNIGTAIEYGTRETIPLFGIYTILSGILLLYYIRNLAYLGMLKRMDDVFRNDPDGSVPAADIVKYLQTTHEKLMKVREYGEKKNVLINLVYDTQKERFILTDRFKPGDPVKDRPFVGMDCPGCGANLKIRAATTGVCPYCDRQVTAPNILVER